MTKASDLRLRLRGLRKELLDRAIPTAMVLRERPGGERPSTPLRARGSFLSPGERVFAGVPGSLHALPDGSLAVIIPDILDDAVKTKIIGKTAGGERAPSSVITSTTGTPNTPGSGSNGSR